MHVVTTNVGTMLATCEHGLSGRLGDSLFSLYTVSVSIGEGEACVLDGVAMIVDAVSVVVGTILAAPVEKEGPVSTNGIDGTSGTSAPVSVDSCCSSAMVDTVVVTSTEVSPGMD